MRFRVHFSQRARACRSRHKKASLTAFLAALLISALASSALADTPAAERSRDVAQQADSAPKRGLFYEVHGGAATVYLLGTLHVGKPEFYPLDAATNQALTEAKKLYLEVNLADSAALSKTVGEIAVYPEGQSLARALPPELMTKVDAALQRYQLPRESALRMKPWMLGQTLLLLEAARHGYDAAYATEIYLLGLAAGQHKEVLGLETLSEQFALFDRMPAAEQQRFLDEILTTLDTPQIGDYLDGLVGAWAQADARGIELALQRERSEPTAFARDVLPQLIDERNRTMAGKIAAIAQSGTTSFVAVGALHLVGEDGIVEQLRRRGFAVRER
jgi:uncharacterized protein YbaP (TraB family)